MVGNQIVSGYNRVDRTLSGFGWLFVSLADWRGRWVHFLARFGRLAYGVYLSHVLFVEGIQAVAHARGYGSSIGLDLLATLGGIVGGILTALLISRSRYLRWLSGD
jgi:hypothetical protein